MTCSEPVGPEDLAAMRGLLWDYIREMRAIYTGTRMLDELDDATWTRELAALPDKYGVASGAMVLARDAGVPAGCVAMRRLDDTTAEMKRLYVAPRSRGHGVSRLLVRTLAGLAFSRGYERLVFDVGWRQTHALAAYAQMGFTEIEPYHGGSDWFLEHVKFFAAGTRELARMDDAVTETRTT
jgi:GNAT superfamily N-acetyltransferase